MKKLILALAIITGLASCNNMEEGTGTKPTVIPASTTNSNTIKKLLDMDDGWNQSGVYEMVIDGNKYVVFKTSDGVSAIKL